MNFAGTLMNFAGTLMNFAGKVLLHKFQTALVCACVSITYVFPVGPVSTS